MNIRCLYDECLPISELKGMFHPKNRNKHPEDQIQRLAQILKYQGVRYPVKISRLSGAITSGHGRVLAAALNGWDSFPVNYQDYDDEVQEYADVQADNAIASWSELDLSGINMDIGELGPFDINLLGIRNFEVEPLDKLDPQCDEDEVPEKVEPRTKLGDIYQLGRHRLMCGDSTSIDAVERLMNGEKADMVFTDPPYNTGMGPKNARNNSGGGQFQKGKSGSTRLSHMFDDAFTGDEWQSLLAGFCSNYWLAMKDNSVAYICLDWRRSHELVPHIKNHFKFSNLIIWDKMVHGLGSDYKYTHEFIHVCKKGDPELKTNQGEQDYKDIWHIQRKMGRDADHATKKPIEIVERAINHASKDNDLVLDLFGGSGSTLIACEKTNRRCFMMELDPHYCDVIVARWEKYTGQKALLLSNEAQSA